MNERLAQLYEQAIVIESNGDYVAGELDPVRFAESIVRECCQMMLDMETKYPANLTVREIKKHFGV